MENDTFQRSEYDTRGPRIGASFYNLIIGLVLAWGFFVNWIMIKTVPYEFLASIPLLVFLLGYFAACFFGLYLFTSSDNPVVSFIGYNFVVVPFGTVINLVVYNYDQSLVMDAVRVTALVTVVMMTLGSLFPLFFDRISGALTVALLAVIIIELIEIFIFKVHHGILDWIVAVIFCGYIGYDWGRANRIPRTVDNAVDSAASLYMDIINLFLRILRIMGRRR